MWIANPRIGSSHTFVYHDNRGYEGNCLPKYISAIVSQAKKYSVDTTLLDGVMSKNKKYKK